MLWSQSVSLCLLLLHLAAVYTVFLDGQAANQVLTRQRRANSLFEELKPGDMERECVEERCSLEEANEIFENIERTHEFWAVYVDGDACLSNPCIKGVCKDTIGNYICYCQSGYQGFNCETETPTFCENKNGDCEHFCSVHNGSVQCSCADGYYLRSDNKSCHSDETFKCGALITSPDLTRSVVIYEQDNVTEESVAVFNQMDMNTNLTQANSSEVMNSSVTLIEPEEVVIEEHDISQMAETTRSFKGYECPPGECPWQALLMNEDNRGFCGGTILNQYIILSSASCMNQSRYISVMLGEYDLSVKEGNEAEYRVEKIIIHNRYRPETYHNDIALIKLAKPIQFSTYILPVCLPEQDFAEKVLMNQPYGIVSGFGHLGQGQQMSNILERISVPYVDRVTCLESTQLRITSRMFCAGYGIGIRDVGCKGGIGAPHVTRYNSTYFVTGIGSWTEGCTLKGKYVVYTQVSKYIRWIYAAMEAVVVETDGQRLKRHAGPIKRITL